LTTFEAAAAVSKIGSILEPKLTMSKLLTHSVFVYLFWKIFVWTVLEEETKYKAQYYFSLLEKTIFWREKIYSLFFYTYLLSLFSAIGPRHTTTNT